MDRPGALSPSEVSKLFGVSRSTLFRWEKEEFIPKTRRGSGNNQRLYTPTHIRAIIDRLRKDQLKVRADGAVENVDEMRELMRTFSLWKFAGGDIHGLYELAEHELLPRETVRLVVKIANQLHDLFGSIFPEIVQVVIREKTRTSISNQAAL